MLGAVTITIVWMVGLDGVGDQGKSGMPPREQGYGQVATSVEQQAVPPADGPHTVALGGVSIQEGGMGATTDGGGDSPSRALPAAFTETVVAELDEPPEADGDQTLEHDVVLRRTLVRATQGLSGVNLRGAPTTSAPSLVVVRNNLPIDILDGSTTRDGYTWVRARTIDGVTGWIVSAAVAD